jgi:hypothetical protein
MRYTWTVNHRVVSRRWEMFLNQILRNVAPGPCPIRVFWLVGQYVLDSVAMGMLLDP